MPICASVATSSHDNIVGFIATGEVPGLHSQEELEPLLSPLKELMREDGNHKTTYDFFVSRVQKNLHVALCMVRGRPLFFDVEAICKWLEQRIAIYANPVTESS